MKSLVLAAGLSLFSAFSAHAEPTYMIAQIQVEDWDNYMKEYGGAALPVILEQGGKVLVAAPEVEKLEGSWSGNLTVVLEFPSQENANAWYQSEEYQNAIPLRHKYASKSTLVLAPGFVPPNQ
jgi:uncharacterized protein (DUF1330 family)